GSSALDGSAGCLAGLVKRNIRHRKGGDRTCSECGLRSPVGKRTPADADLAATGLCYSAAVVVLRGDVVLAAAAFGLAARLLALVPDADLRPEVRRGFEVPPPVVEADSGAGLSVFFFCLRPPDPIFSARASSRLTAS